MTKLVETAEAIFDEYRLQIIKLLQIREMCVCELAAVLDLSSPRISQHLAVLRRSKIVKERREGKWIFYSLIPRTIEGFNQSWSQFFEVSPDLSPEMKIVIKRLQKLDLADVREHCVTSGKTADETSQDVTSKDVYKKVSNITKLKKEGTTSGN